MKDFHSILKTYWGYDAFRPLQEEVIQSVADGNDTLGLMPTGGGKSITFQVFSLATEGMCLVVTPLIALMKDQVENLKQRKIKALAIYSGMTRREIDLTMNNAVYGDYKFLYVSPERLSSPIFQEYLLRMNINLITVDEAHCISQWGYDFRPSYLKIADLREFFPEVPMLALTATATPAVVSDIQSKLKFRKERVLEQSFLRKNLSYLVRQKEDKQGYLLETVKRSKGSGIVYARSRKKTREIAQLLRQHQVSADFYHAGLDHEARAHKQDLWKQGEIRVIVATNAFGMGIDKPDVRFVVHVDPPDSLEAYFQEAGRAGRDGNRAAAVLLFNNGDKRNLNKMVSDSFPPIETIRRVYQALGNYFTIAIGSGAGQFFDFNLTDFARNFHFQPTTVYNSLKILQREGYLELTDEQDNPARVNFTIGRDELYKFQVANASFDTFIKMMLRSYTGLFTDYVGISEEMLAKRSQTTVDTIYQYLARLGALKIIHYIPKRKSPVVVFLKERVAENRLRITPEHYHERRKRYQKRVDAVIEYGTSESQCRSQMLLAYFGQENSLPCGKCDYCNGDHEAGMAMHEFEQIRTALLQALEAEHRPIVELAPELGLSEKKLTLVARWLLDNNVLQLDGNGCLSVGSAGA